MKAFINISHKGTCLFDGLPFEDGLHGPKNLLLSHYVVVGHVGEHRRLNKVALRQHPFEGKSDIYNDRTRKVCLSPPRVLDKLSPANVLQMAQAALHVWDSPYKVAHMVADQTYSTENASDALVLASSKLHTLKIQM